jgi:hypothetical protein
MIRMIGSNSGDFVCTQVLHNLWKLFLCKKHVQETSRLKKENKKKITINEAYNKSSDNMQSNNSINNDSEARTSNNNGETSDDENYEDEEDMKTSTTNPSFLSMPTKSIIRNVRANVKPKKKTILLRLFKSTSSGTKSPPSRSPLRKSPPALARSLSTVTSGSSSMRAQSMRKNLVIRRMNDNFEGNRFQSIKRVTVAKRVTTTDK